MEQDKEDREVEKILMNRKEAKRKLATGMYAFNVRQVERCAVQYMCQCMILQQNVCQTCWTVHCTILTLFSAVRTVAEGHRMIVDGWTKFEEVVENAGAGDLPQLLWHLKGMMTLTSTMPPAPTPAPMDVQSVSGEQGAVDTQQ